MANDITIDAGSLYEEVYEAVRQNVEHNIETLEADVYALADDAVDELKEAKGPWSQTEDDPKTGRPAYFYEKGWKVYKHKMVEGHVDAVVANKHAPSLTHLIEFPHELFYFGHDTGRMTTPRPHIKEAYEHAVKRWDGKVT